MAGSVVRRLPPRPTAIIEREQERQAQARRVRLTDPEAPRDRRLAKVRLDAERAKLARRRQASADEAAHSAVMAELRTPGSPLRVLGLSCEALAEQAEVPA
ncbi:hypothetical protein SAMN06264364_1497 [Quadrisphaera granulorum]|uniref:Uncharacterized protein n=1 Tax=Quadrisphaera granulorum TaxID=317664 RepID=A0A315ZL54_9ACTN|nr:hypothetical protein [Quadrisphaera granulorum]PWJ46271.1 hypothetical protein BXY45_1497 [Quadrisphaera granulorum]SZE99086.1 hypothetical protein SAMN06264364_1497 [Quadrisphaera granulorum]